MFKPPNIYKPIYVCASVKGDHLTSQGITTYGSVQQKEINLAHQNLYRRTLYSLRRIFPSYIYESSKSSGSSLCRGERTSSWQAHQGRRPPKRRPEPFQIPNKRFYFVINGLISLISIGILDHTAITVLQDPLHTAPLHRFIPAVHWRDLKKN